MERSLRLKWLLPSLVRNRVIWLRWVILVVLLVDNRAYSLLQEIRLLLNVLEVLNLTSHLPLNHFKHIIELSFHWICVWKQSTLVAWSVVACPLVLRLCFVLGDTSIRKIWKPVLRIDVWIKALLSKIGCSWVMAAVVWTLLVFLSKLVWWSFFNSKWMSNSSSYKRLFIRLIDLIYDFRSQARQWIASFCLILKLILFERVTWENTVFFFLLFKLERLGVFTALLLLQLELLFFIDGNSFDISLVQRFMNLVGLLHHHLGHIRDSLSFLQHHLRHIRDSLGFLQHHLGYIWNTSFLSLFYNFWSFLHHHLRDIWNP